MVTVRTVKKMSDFFYFLIEHYLRIVIEEVVALVVDHMAVVAVILIIGIILFRAGKASRATGGCRR